MLLGQHSALRHGFKAESIPRSYGRLLPVDRGDAFLRNAGSTYKTTQCHNPVEHDPYSGRRENMKPPKLICQIWLCYVRFLPDTFNSGKVSYFAEITDAHIYASKSDHCC
jgi:hypothetical protein